MRYNPSGDTPFQLSQILNQGIELGDNVRGALIEVELDEGVNEVSHDLGYVPLGYIILLKESEGDVWAAQLSNWNTSTLFLQSSVENQKVRLFVA